MAKKKLTILHSNDMHGDFLPTIGEDGREIGGLARLSGYVRQERAKNNHTLYVIAGDMFRGSIIDAEYRGLSTIDLVNAMSPDVATVGNHEVDYGLAHLLFLEKCATFPIINANMFVTINNTRLFTPYLNIDINGMRILFIGILTEEVIASTRQEEIIGTFVDVEEAAREVGIICDNYRNRQTDLTVLLTHIGVEQDRELARLLNPDWGVDLIIGGHSHTLMEQAEIVNGIPIVQAGSGTSHIGRIELVCDTWHNDLTSFSWTCEEINEDTAPVDPLIEELVSRYQNKTDAKYKRLVGRFARRLTHPSRTQETEMGNLYADMMQEDSSFDIMLFGSGSIRKTEMGPLIEYQDMMENTPFDGPLYMVSVTGAQFRRIVQHLFRDEAWEGHTEFYQVSRGVHIVYRKSTHEIETLELNGAAITDGQELTFALQDYHFNNFDEFMGIPLAEVEANAKPRVVATSTNNIVEEYLSTHPVVDAHVEGRITILE